MPWLKYRHKFAHGKGSWYWRDLGFATNASAHSRCVDRAETIVEELAREYDFSDKYRGLDFEIIDDSLVPSHVVESALECNASVFRQAERNARRLDEQAKIVKPCPTCGALEQILGDKRNELTRTGHFLLDCPDCGRASVIIKQYTALRLRCL